MCPHRISCRTTQNSSAIMQAHSPIPPISPHPANPYTRYAANQPLNAGAVADVAPPPPPQGHHLQSPPPIQPGFQGSHSPLRATPNHPGDRRPHPIGIPPNSASSSFYPPGPVTSGFVPKKRLIVACDGELIGMSFWRFVTDMCRYLA